MATDSGHALDVDDGATVMQAGTGTGYTAALLCERLGSDRVVSIDVDPQLTHPAGQRLRSCGPDEQWTWLDPVTLLIKPGEGLQATGHGMTCCPCR